MVEEGYRSGFVALIGRPNVGKSTLLNRIVGQKVAIMSDKPQTTRNKIQGIYTGPDYQIIFIDTPGIHRPKHKLGEYLVEVTYNTLKEVDVILYVVDATAEYGGGEEYIINSLEGVRTPVFLLLNKVDLIRDKGKILELIAQYNERYPFAQILPVSALQGDNLDRLLQVLGEHLPEGPQYYPEDMVTDQPERFVMAELIREKVLLLTREEVPHSVAVVVETIQERGNGKLYVGAVIYVERESQKGIIIGKRGQMLKEIGRLARLDIEALLGSPIYLELWVKVKSDWRRREVDLRNFGYTLND